MKDISNQIAIIGLTCRFPKARNLNEFWQNLRNGIETVSFFTDEELLAEGVDQALLTNPLYVKASAVLEDVELFDAAFFEVSPREAETMDPQHRLFLEYAWEVLEMSGYNPDTYAGKIGVFAGAGMSTYLLYNLLPNPALLQTVSSIQLLMGNNKDFMPTRVSYKLNLKGPSMNISTACSTSLVAVHLACQSLLDYQCDIALAGGSGIQLPQKQGYLYHEGGINSPDGHCRAFDAKARGTVSGNGVGIVVLKRLEDALHDGDYIHAIILGTACNNDGAAKVGYTAPSVEGQSEVIAEAQAVAKVNPDTITYIETHGTGTTLGDPIEVQALTEAFQLTTNKQHFCAIGSVKTNFGHLDEAAGVAGLIKTVLALKNKMIPPSLHFEQPNPNIDFANSPFYVNAQLEEWRPPTKDTPRRAGVSSFGIGGTNAHIVLEEAPPRPASSSSRPWQLLTLSAKTASAVEVATANLAEYLNQEIENLNHKTEDSQQTQFLADVAYTLKIGRKTFKHRRFVLGSTIEEVIQSLQTGISFCRVQEPIERPIAFMFSGQGSQYIKMGWELYQTEATFRESIDHCAKLLQAQWGLNLLKVLGYEPNLEGLDQGLNLNQTALAQPALFVIEYALAQLWFSWGVRPQALIGHSIGEYVAACLADVFSLEDALTLVVTRGRLMQQLPRGAMLVVPLSEAEVQPLLGEDLEVATVNEPSRCVISGTIEAIEQFETLLQEKAIEGRRLHTSHAFHSHLMTPILEPFLEQVKQVKLKPPTIPYISNVTGTWITVEQATDPHYYAQHLRQTVRFSDGLQQLLQEPNRILLEIGPGNTLTTFALRHSSQSTVPVILSSLRHPQDPQADIALLLTTVGQLWLAGVEIDWAGFYAQEQRQRLPLPTYPFERQRYWSAPSVVVNSSKVSIKKPIAEWFYTPSWKRSYQTTKIVKNLDVSAWLVFMDDDGLGSQLVQRLRELGQDVITVSVGTKIQRLSDQAFCLRADQPADYQQLISGLTKHPQKIVHLWTVARPKDTSLSPKDKEDEDRFERVTNTQQLGFYSILYLIQALDQQNLTHHETIYLTVISNNMQEVIGDDGWYPEKATLLGPVKVIPQEYPNLRCQSIDLDLRDLTNLEALVDPLLVELTQPATAEYIIAYRGRHRWIHTFEPVRLTDSVSSSQSRFRQHGVYLITGGLGGVGLILAEYLAQYYQAKLVLLGRTGLEPGVPQSEAKRNLVQKLENLGSEILILNADVADGPQMEKAISQTYQRFGQLHGIIHAAGVTRGEFIFNLIPETQSVHAETLFRPKIYGTYVLDTVLRGKSLDFIILISSNAATLGGLGLCAYSAASLFQDAFAMSRHHTKIVPWLSTNWDGWPTEEALGQQVTLQTSIDKYAMTRMEAVTAFTQIVTQVTSGQIVVSAGDLQDRLNLWTGALMTQHQQSQRLEESNTPPNNVATTTEGIASCHTRSHLATDYVAPQNEIEQILTNLWQELLGTHPIGIHDNFFELRGDSLLGTQMLSQVSKLFQMQVPLRSLFEVPTIAALAERLEKLRWSTQTLQAQIVEKLGETEEEGEI